MIRAAHLFGNEVHFGGVEKLADWREQGGKLWLDIEGEGAEREKQLLSELGCHPLATQDALRERRPPKIEEFDEYCFILYRGFVSSDALLDVKTMALAGFINEDLLITRRDAESFGVNALWQTEKLNKYLLHPALLFSKVMNASAQRYMEAVVEVEDEISVLEDGMLAQSNDELMHRLITLKSHLRKLHRMQTYHTKLMRKILSGEIGKLGIDKDEHRHSFVDVYDKFERLESLSLMYYDLCGDLIEGYISLSSHQLNKTMQLLTVVSAVFVPLTFIAGIYGMNFEYIPELSFKYGYFALWGVMLLVGGSLLYVFRKKRWL